MDDEFPGSMLLPCLLLSSAVLLLLLSVWDWGADKEREERRLRREKILKNTKDEAIKQAQEPILSPRKPGDEETEGLGRVAVPLDACVVRARV